MIQRDVVVVGAGISGVSFAHRAARAGRDVLLLERGAHAGGCLNTVQGADGFWFELGGHTFYNSYAATIELLEECDALGELQPRAKPVLRFLRDQDVLPGKNLGLLLRQFRKLELLRCIPRWFTSGKSGKTVREHFSSLVGSSNYELVLRPMLSAVPSQCADELPADLLFKKRARRKDILRSFTFRSGASTLIDVSSRSERIETRFSQEITRIVPTADGFQLTLADGLPVAARVLALAVPPSAAAVLLEGLDEKLSSAVRSLQEVRVESLGVVLPKARVRLPEATFFIPLDDCFHSIVTRDVVPHAQWRALTFHFRPGLLREERLARAAAVLRVPVAELGQVAESQAILPAPRLGHAQRITALDRALAGQPLALTGNWFGGLSVEDCVLRSRNEWRRIAH